MDDNTLMIDSLYPRIQNLNETIDDRILNGSIYNAFDIKENTDNLLSEFELIKLFGQNEEKYQKYIINNKFTKIYKWEDIKNYINIMGPTIRPNSISYWCRRTFWCFCINN